jgi:hypothetical protein
MLGGERIIESHVTSPNQGLFLPRKGKGKEPGNEDG